MNTIQYSNKNYDENADNISDLPTNRIQPSHNEIKIVDTLFKKHSSTLGNITKEFKDSIVLGILFLILSLPQVDNLFKKYISITNNSIYMLILIKTIFFIVALWIIKNYNLLKRD
jgi:hypothetical protein